MKPILLYLFIAIPFFSFAQSNFNKGYVVTHVNDTLKGYINYKERSLNPKSVQFRTAADSKTRIFNLKDCAAYGIEDHESFQRYVIDISMSSTNVSSLSVGRDSSSRRDTVFLRVLQTGKNVTLYSYKDDFKLRFYVKEKDSTVPYELILQLFMDPDRVGQIVTENKYAGQLRAIMMKFNVAAMTTTAKLRALTYTDRDLIRIVAIINEQQAVKSKYEAARFFAGAGLNMSRASYSGSNDLAGSGSTDRRSYLPMVTGGIDIFANPAIGKLIYRVELSLLASKNKISGTTAASEFKSDLTHEFDQYSAVLTPQIIYNLYNARSLKIFLGAGVGLNLSKYSHNRSTDYEYFSQRTTVTDNQVELQAFNFSLPLRAGIVLNKKIELSAVYTGASAISDYASYNVVMQRFSIGVNYLFGK